MNILYITYLHGKKWTGPNYSVPNQIYAQSKYDRVFWYNINDLFKESNYKGIKCNDINDYPDLKVNKLPAPFNKPDLVIFEGVYFIKYCTLAKECRLRNIPYIIIPRSSLTSYAQKSKWAKKKLANFLIFSRFIKNAVAIQYLTDKEYQDSGEKWNERHMIIPNGIDFKNEVKKSSETDVLRGVFIGRPDIYQKGIDLLLEACLTLKEQLINSNCLIELYGPAIGRNKEEIQKTIDRYKLNKILIQKDGVFDDEKEKILLNSDFFVLTSRFEGHPMGLIEALSYGLPSLVTIGTNMAEEIEAYDAGWVSDISSHGIQKALKSLLNEKSKIKEKGKNALELSKKYNWDTLAEISHTEYQKLQKN